MKEKLKNFFKKNMAQEPKVAEPVNEVNLEGEKRNVGGEVISISMETWGFNQARLQHGNHLAFSGFMNLVKEEYKKREILKQGKTEESIKSAQEELDRLEAEIKAKKSVIDICKDKIEQLKEKIDELKKDIIRIKENPQELIKDRMSKVGFFIGLFILIFLTIYLFIFYSSASYAGFFKDFTAEDSVTSSIFDPQALSKAYQEGATELVLILTVPFIFLGLGYLIHKFQEGAAPAKYFRIGGMILITFGFDALLAYKIEKGLYEVERLMDPTGSMPPHKLSMALDSENFWLVIFAGFIVYIIWGFVFDFVMEAYDKLDIVKQAIKARETEIKLREEDIQKENQEIEKAKAEITKLEADCVKPRAIISGRTVVIDWAGFGQALLEFTGGWANWMTANHIKQEAIDVIWHTRETFFKEHQALINKVNN